MAKALSRAQRLLSRAGRLLRDDPACVTQCCGRTGPPCCYEEIAGRPETRHDCGALVSGQCYHASVETIQGAFSSNTVTQFYRKTITNDVLTATHAAAAERIVGDECARLESVIEQTTTVTASRTASQRATACSSLCFSGTVCGTSLLVPMQSREEASTREQITNTVTQGNPLTGGEPPCPGFPRVTPFDTIDDTATNDEWCEGVVVSCWPLGVFTTNQAGGFNPSVGGVVRVPPRANIRVVPGESDVTTPDNLTTGSDFTAPNIYGGQTRTVITYNRIASTRTIRSGSLSFSGGVVSAQFFGSSSERVSGDSSIVAETIEYIGYNFPDIGQGTVVRRTFEETRSSTISESNTTELTQYSLGWDIGCDGGPGPTPCVPTLACQDIPSDLRYIVGKPCGGAVVERFLLPVENVRSCGYVQHNGWCYLFEPGGQRTQTPDGVVGTDIVTQDDFRDCCSCMGDLNVGCLSNEVPSYPEWRNGLRQINGQWVTYPPTPSPGICCCSNDDKFRLIRGQSRQIDYDDQNNEIVVFETRILPLIFQGTGRQDPFDGFRRIPLPTESPELGWTIREETFVGGQSQGFSERLGTASREPIGCEWDWQLFKDPFALGFVSIAPDLRPYAADADGNVGNGVRLLRYNLFANCTSLFAQVEAEQLESGTGRRIRYYTAVVEWAIEKRPSGPCEGDCGNPTSVTAKQARSTLDVLALAGGV